MEPYVQVEYLIQARDHLWAEGKEWERLDELWGEFKD